MGPRYHVYVVAARDLAVFTLGRLPDKGQIRNRAEDLAERLHVLLAGDRMRYGDAGQALGTHGNNLRYAALTGTLAIRWEGARLPTVWTVPPPEIELAEATRELARRYLHVFGPARRDGFAKWAGLGARQALRAFDDLSAELIPVQTPHGDAWLLSRDEPTMREPPHPAAAARFLPSGDAYTLGITSDDRELLLPDAGQRGELWTPRVWPGASCCRQGRRHLAPRRANDHDQALAEALPFVARGGRRRGRIAAAARDRWASRRPLDLMRTGGSRPKLTLGWE